MYDISDNRRFFLKGAAIMAAFLGGVVVITLLQSWTWWNEAPVLQLYLSPSNLTAIITYPAIVIWLAWYILPGVVIYFGRRLTTNGQARKDLNRRVFHYLLLGRRNNRSSYQRNKARLIFELGRKLIFKWLEIDELKSIVKAAMASLNMESTELEEKPTLSDGELRQSAREHLRTFTPEYKASILAFLQEGRNQLYYLGATFDNTMTPELWHGMELIHSEIADQVTADLKHVADSVVIVISEPAHASELNEFHNLEELDFVTPSDWLKERRIPNDQIPLLTPTQPTISRAPQPVIHRTDTIVAEYLAWLTPMEKIELMYYIVSKKKFYEWREHSNHLMTEWLYTEAAKSMDLIEQKPAARPELPKIDLAQANEMPEFGLIALIPPIEVAPLSESAAPQSTTVDDEVPVDLQKFAKQHNFSLDGAALAKLTTFALNGWQKHYNRVLMLLNNPSGFGKNEWKLLAEKLRETAQ